MQSATSDELKSVSVKGKAPSSLVETFRSAALEILRQERAYRVRLQKKDVERILVEQSERCLYCDAPIALHDTETKRRAVISELIPSALGGGRGTNHLLSCASCELEKSGRDWLAWGKAVDVEAMTRRRSALLLDTLHHVLPLSVRSPAVGVKRLSERWASPRFRIFAQSFVERGLFALPLGTDDGGASAILMRGFGATRVEETDGDEGLIVFVVDPKKFHDAAWELIQVNALVVPVTMAETYFLYEPDLDDEHKTRWDIRLPGSRWRQECSRVREWCKQTRPLTRAAKREAWARERDKVWDVVRDAIRGKSA